ncbi:hypothetical protein ACFC6U_11830 [Kitasatospora purpeofusca]|uniref:hypothetical protein n=1 Tax=Kitasatospora purpeofusca TaxID=67352 RepID=UPI0035DE5412
MEPLVKQLADGRTVHVRPVITAYGAVTYTAVDDDGRTVAGGWLQEAREHGVPETQRPEGHTHLIAGTLRLWFTAAEAERLTALGAKAEEAFTASPDGQRLAAWRRDQEELQAAEAAATAILRTPEGRARAGERAGLKEAANAIAAADDAQRERAEDSGELGLYYREQQPANEARLAQALARLDAFDAQHPQIVAALDAEKEARTRRFLEAD